MDESDGWNKTEDTGTREDERRNSSDVGSGERTTKTSRKQTSRLRNSKPIRQPKTVKDVILDDWQKEAINHRGNLLLKTGRQVGKTYIMSRKSAERMVSDPNTKIICVSLTEDQAQLIIVMVLDYLEKHYKTWIAKGHKKPTKNKVELTNGSSIIARPIGNTADSIRGFTADILILDEASRFNGLIFEASMPTLLTTGGEIWMCSTPFGKKGYFYDTYLANKDKENPLFKVIETNSVDVLKNRAISEVWTEEKRDKAILFLDAQKEQMTKLSFAQEYLGLFVEDLQQFFSDDIILRSTILKRPTIAIPKTCTIYLGVDVARMGEDHSAFQILIKYNSETIEHIESITTTKNLITDTYDRIIYLDDIYNFNKIGIDAGTGSLGVGLLDFLMRSKVRNKVVPLSNMSRPLDHLGEKKKVLAKEDMYQNLLAMLESGKLKLLDDDNVRASLKSVQYEYSTEENSTNRIKIFSNPHNLSDIVEALMRSAYLANQKDVFHGFGYLKA